MRVAANLRAKRGSQLGGGVEVVRRFVTSWRKEGIFVTLDKGRLVR